MFYVCRCYLRPENKIKVSERKYLKSQQNDKGNNSFRLCNKKIKLARCARSHIHRFFLILVSCQYNVLYAYIAPYHK